MRVWSVKITMQDNPSGWILRNGHEAFVDPGTGSLLAIVIGSTGTKEGITFMTEDTEELQIGSLRWNAGHRIDSHSHRPLRRVLSSTGEVLFVRSGKVQMNLFTSEGEFLTSRMLSSGDVVALLRGGHGFKILEDAEIIEVKQGPFTGVDEKYRFPIGVDL